MDPNCRLRFERHLFAVLSSGVFGGENESVTIKIPFDECTSFIFADALCKAISRYASALMSSFDTVASFVFPFAAVAVVVVVVVVVGAVVVVVVFIAILSFVPTFQIGK